MSKDDYENEEDFEKDKELCEKELKWCWAKALIGLWKIVATAEFWVFLAVTILFVIFADKDNTGVWIAYVSLGGAFMFYRPLSKLIERANMNVNLNAGASVNKNV